jgi:hypothetical protein
MYNLGHGTVGGDQLAGSFLRPIGDRQATDVELHLATAFQLLLRETQASGVLVPKSNLDRFALPRNGCRLVMILNGRNRVSQRSELQEAAALALLSSLVTHQMKISYTAASLEHGTKIILGKVSQSAHEYLALTGGGRHGGGGST